MYLKDNIFEQDKGNQQKTPATGDEGGYWSTRVPDQAAPDEVIKKLAIIAKSKNAGMNTEIFNRATAEFSKKKSKYITFVIFLGRIFPCPFI